MFRLSIAIVSYHNFKDVEKLIESIQRYTDKAIVKTIYIIDNADEFFSYEKLVQQYSDIKYIHTKKNLGFGKAHNLILDQLDSEFHVILNPDIIFLEDSLKALCLYMNDFDVEICAPRMVNENKELLYVYRKEITLFDLFVRYCGKTLFLKRYKEHVFYDQDYNMPFHVPFVQGSFLMLCTSLWKSLKGFDERYFMYLEDADLCKRANQMATVMYCPDTTVIHQWKQGSHKSIQLARYHVVSLCRYMLRWGVQWC